MDQFIETVRNRYRPKRIMTLFVGESAPHNGTFFYIGNTAMLHYMQQAVEEVLGTSDDFLGTFKSYGWYLDDLVPTPVDHLPRPQRKIKCLEAQDSLADRIAAYQPEAIVSLLKSIKPFVDAAAVTAGSKAPRYAVPFSGMGHQNRFKAAMINLIPDLPRLRGAL